MDPDQILQVKDEDSPKYIVFKLEDYEAGNATSLDDAVVIRLKDPFAATALHTYANTILSSVELLEDFITQDDYQRMLDIADYFHNQALDSEKIKGKRLPD
jgi:hypothetical protein